MAQALAGAATAQAAPAAASQVARPAMIRAQVLAPRPATAGASLTASCIGPAGRPRPRTAVIRSARSGSSGVLDSETKVAPGKATEGANKKPPIYKVMLHNDNYNRREYVVKVLLKVVEGYTVDDAMVVMQEAHEQGLALVVACAQDQAEQYVEDLRGNGLVSTLEV